MTQDTADQMLRQLIRIADSLNAMSHEAKVAQHERLSRMEREIARLGQSDSVILNIVKDVASGD